MKRFAKFLVTSVLLLLSRGVLRRYNPSIVMVTGSVGKTSTKDAVAAVLSTRFLVRKSEKSFNSEFGVPFTILGVENPWDNPSKWFAVLRRGLGLIFLPNHYPKMLVLEVGADRPGDLARILRVATPDAVVVTRLPEIPVHVEAYTTPEAVRDEEFSPAYALRAASPLIVCADDPYAMEDALRTHARVISYGHAGKATLRLGKAAFYETEGEVAGMQTEVTVGDEKATLVVKGSIGGAQVLSAAAALAAAHAFDIPLSAALEALRENYVPPAGRGRLLEGKDGAVLIDDSYNSSPVAVEQALETLKAFPKKGARRIAVLGDMLELGRYSVTEHERIGALARESADLVVAVGIRSRVFANTSGKTEVLSFDTSQAAAEALVPQIKAGDIILIKGSQSIRTERIVKALLADSDDAHLLVRQDRRWLARA